MTRLDIDFAPPGWRRSRHRVPMWGWLAGTVGLLLCVTAALAGSVAVERQRVREAQLQRAQLRVAASMQAPMPVAPVPIAPAQAAAVNAAIAQLNLPWLKLQDALATATPAAVALLALEPDARKQMLKITAETRSSDAMIEYIAQLKQQELFGTRVQLLRHEINELDPNKPMRFQIEAHWSTQ